MSSERADRSSDGENLDFAALPVIGMMALARTAGEGTKKYGRFNYLLGMKSVSCLNHAIRHIYLHLAGDESEAHLPHAAWNILAAIQSEVLDPKLNEGTMPSPGCKMGPALQTELYDQRPYRAAAREVDDNSWVLKELEEVLLILNQRESSQ